MYSRLQESYYARPRQPFLKRDSFKTIAPIFVLDLTHQNETVKTGPIDIRIELKTQQNISLNTSAYCLNILDRMF